MPVTLANFLHHPLHGDASDPHIKPVGDDLLDAVIDLGVASMKPLESELNVVRSKERLNGDGHLRPPQLFSSSGIRSCHNDVNNAMSPMAQAMVTMIMA